MVKSATRAAKAIGPEEAKSEEDTSKKKLINLDEVVQKLKNNGVTISSGLLKEREAVAETAEADYTHTKTGTLQQLPKSNISIDISKWSVHWGEGNNTVEIVVDEGPVTGRQCTDAVAQNFVKFEAYLAGRIQTTGLITSDSMIDENNLVALVNSTYAEDFYGVRDSLTIYAAKLANLEIPNMMGLVACGELTLQQFIYSCIAAVFLAFRPLLYCADQSVTAYHGVESVPGVSMNVGQHSAACMPDGAIRLSVDYYAIAMM
jgi:hypothetical protein